MAPLVVYQGEPGAYSDQAARELLGKDVKTVGMESFERCFFALKEGRCDFAMMPIENSMGGSVHACFDLQVRFDFNIVAELDFRVRHCLMALPGVNLSDIEFVISHYQALAQCEQYFRRKGLQSKRDYDTAGSAKRIFEENLQNHAAVASKLAAKVHNLEILEEGIEDDPNNVTRFFLLSKKCLIPPTTLQLLRENTINYKTSIVVSFENIPGALCRALSFFASNGIDLTKLESRPNKLHNRGVHLPNTLSSEVVGLFNENKTETFESGIHQENRYPFIFYMDISGSVSDFKVISSLRKIASISHYFRVLGSYPTNGILQQFVAKAVAVKNNAILRNVEQKNSETQMKTEAQTKLTIAIIGFGNFGQFLAKTFVSHHKVVAYNKTDESFEALKLGIPYYSDINEMLTNETQVNVVLFSVAILAFESVLESIKPELLHNKVLVDVLSVKLFPKEKLLQFVSKLSTNDKPGVLCTHPMFGPQSGKYSWKNLPMMFEKVCHGSEKNFQIMNSFLNIFQEEGCRMVEMTCDEHDKQAADSQFITHFLGRTIDRIGLEPPADKSKEISTQGFKSLLNIRDQTTKDSFDLFSALYGFNSNSKTTIKNLRSAINSVHGELEAMSGKHVTKSEERPLYLPSKSVTNMSESQTGAIFALATKLRNEGKDIVMSLCVGEPDFSPPKAVLDATKAAVDAGYTKYTTNAGLVELRQEISRDLKQRKGLEYAVNEVLVTPSGKQALFLVLKALLKEDDEVVIPSPYWTSYPEMVKFGGGKPVIVQRDIENDFILQPNELEKVLNPKTKMIILCNPCNPTGCFYTKKDLEALVKVLNKEAYKHILVLSDEIYERLVYDNSQSTCFASLPGMKERTIVVNGFSKAFAMTGYRLGYIASNKSLTSWCTKLQSQLNSCACSISQHAGIAALRNVAEEDLQPLYSNLQKKRDLIVGLLQQVPHLKLASAKGAFYVLPDVSHYMGMSTPSKKLITSSSELCTYLIEEQGVALVPGDAFGAGATVRFSFATSFKDIEEAVLRFKSGLSSLS